MTNNQDLDPFLRKQLELLSQYGNGPNNNLNFNPNNNLKYVDHETEDAKLAKILSEQMNVKTNDPKDEELARRFQEDEMRLIKEDEERKKKQLSDSEFARKMYEDEMRLIKEDEERKKKTRW